MLTDEQRQAIVTSAIGFLGRPYEEGFKCTDFIREAYRHAGLTLPPPHMNLSLRDLDDPPIGYVLYLKHKEHGGSRRLTHAVILLPDRMCIHSSYFFGMKVVTTALDDVLAVYEIAS
jgi:hypothetical protein